MLQQSDAWIARSRRFFAHGWSVHSIERRRQSLSTARPGLEVIITNSRQFFDESYDGPDLVVGYFNGAKTRHAGHVDSVLDHPEQLLRRALVGYLFKIGRVRI
jgi:hypothetical protein